MSVRRRVLFLCTGNYYRSRYAEILFNHRARQSAIGWHADSRALAIELGACNVGPISRHVRQAMAEQNLACDSVSRMPAGCAETDLAGADLVIALKEAEHRAYLQQKFPNWADRVRYWHVHDVDQASPADALSLIRRHVDELFEELRSG